ncbi:MAG: IS21 family transposase [bacterium]
MIKKGEAMDIWSLHRQGLSFREIGRKLGLDRRTVKKYIENQEFPVYVHRARQSKLAPYFGLIRDWLSTDDYTATWIYDRLKLQNYSGSYDTVKRFVNREKSRRGRLAYARFETEPGLQAQVDFSEFRVLEPDGHESIFYLFSMVLGYARALYAEFVARCTMKTFLECHQRAFGYLGGIPGEILYDNMKNVVIRRLVGRINWNIRFLDFAGHYRFKPVACPPYSPWYKGKVERPFDYIRERFWRGYRFVTLAQTNEDLRIWLDQTANRRIHGTVKECITDRWAKERSALGDIPRRSFDTSDVYTRNVYKDCFVRFRCNSYRVPHRVVGKTVILKVDGDTLRIYHDLELLTVYLLEPGKGQFVEDRDLLHDLLTDQDQIHRKYRTSKPKGKATRGLLKDSTEYESLTRDPRIYNVLTGVSS